MKKLSLILLLFAVSLFSIADGPSVLAQGELEPAGFKNVRLWLNPEYDDPRLLVMLEGKIDGVTAPARVRFLVPQAAEMYSAGSKDAQGKYTGGPPERQASGIPGWDEISYMVKTDTFRMEYYDPIITGQPAKTISYEFRSRYPISGLTVTVQQPRRATDFRVQPAGNATGSPLVDTEGFRVIQYLYPVLASGSPLSFEIAYHKSDSEPALPTPDSGKSPSSPNSPADLLWVGVILAALLVVGVLWILKSRPGKKAARRPQAKSSAAFRAKAQPGAGFCRNCGRPLKSTDKFCTNCGAKV
ncbi:MAG: zinc ribbon domain-containing protein [Chloroflexota bacterium]